MEALLGNRAQAIRARFLENTLQHVGRLQVLSRELHGDQPEGAISEVLAICHSLAGAAGTFGFQELGAVATTAEIEASRVQTEGIAAGAELVEAISRLVGAIQALPAVATQSSPRQP